jgi:hypothetical protein
MKTHTTNYYNTFIEVAEDCPTSSGTVPPAKEGSPSVARLQYEMLSGNPYRYDSDDALFSVFAVRKEIPEGEWEEQRQIFFFKGQPCFRASPLTKSYGWGVHSNEEGKLALYGMETAEYQKFIGNASIKKLKAMRSKKK